MTVFAMIVAELYRFVTIMDPVPALIVIVAGVEMIEPGSVTVPSAFLVTVFCAYATVTKSNEPSKSDRNFFMLVLAWVIVTKFLPGGTVILYFESGLISSGVSCDGVQ